MLQNDERKKSADFFPQLSLQTTYENHFIHFVYFTNLDKLWLLPLSFDYNNFLFLLFVVVVVILNYSRMQIRPTSHAHLDVWCERTWTTQFLHEKKTMSKKVQRSTVGWIECNRPNKWSFCAHYLLASWLDVKAQKHNAEWKFSSFF